MRAGVSRATEHLRPRRISPLTRTEVARPWFPGSRAQIIERTTLRRCLDEAVPPQYLADPWRQSIVCKNALPVRGHLSLRGVCRKVSA
jgi:hypothetical protein